MIRIANDNPVVARRPVTTTDLLKFVGVAAFLFDHYGLFFRPDELWWRLFGRLAAPIFFFLIGFGRSRRVPASWIGFGAALTALGAWTSRTDEGFDDVTANILLNFACLRLAVLPVAERHLLRQPLALALFAAGCVLLIDATDRVLEYGTEGWLWALLGLAHRHFVEGETRIAAARAALAAAAAAAYAVRETLDYGFDALQTGLLVLFVLALTKTFLGFRRRALPLKLPGPAASLLRSCGSHSLEIYAITLFAMQFLAYACGERM